jgi:hypothetical protein
MTAHGRVPESREKVLCLRTALEQEPAVRIKDVKVNHGMDEGRISVALEAQGLSDNVSRYINKGEVFLPAH